MLLERFLKYVKIDTMSSEESKETPSTKKQFNLATILVQELLALGLHDAKVDEKCIVTATLPGEGGETIGFIAHMDTIPGFSGTNVNPQIINNYDGGDINLKNNVTLSIKKFPFMAKLIGKTLITTDGTTVLGADDKAGVAEIMEMLSFYHDNPTVKHVTIKVAFTPDEEIGGGIDSFNVKAFGADFAYTVDGGLYQEINYENFNAASALVKIKGLDIHPGSAKGQMVNAASIGCEFEMMLPELVKPMYTEGYEGFNHLCDIRGSVTECYLDYILRNHDKVKLEAQKAQFYEIERTLNQKYGANTVQVEIADSYSNMYEILKKDPKSITHAKERMMRIGIMPITSPIRGGTDGAKLTQMGLNTPNLGTGGYNCHGPYEFSCLEEMQKVVDILIEIAKIN